MVNLDPFFRPDIDLRPPFFGALDFRVSGSQGAYLPPSLKEYPPHPPTHPTTTTPPPTPHPPGLTHRVKNKIANQPLGALDYSPSPSYMLPSSDYTNREPVWWDSRGMLFITYLGTRIDDVIACLLRAHQSRPFEGAQQGPSRVVILPRWL